MKQKRKIGRKIMSFLLVLAIVIGLMPGMSMTAKAQTTLSGNGTESDPYLITSADDWNTLATSVNGGIDYSGKYFRLTEDITVSQMIGINNHASSSYPQTNQKSFSGTFDGNGHTLDLNINDKNTHGAAPFSATKNATIKNLNVTGSVVGGIHSAGLVGVPNGTLTVENCTVSAAISGSTHHGGFVGHAFNATVNLKSCIFDGSLTGGTLGGMIGWSGLKANDRPTIEINNCLFSGTYTEASAFHPVGYTATDGDKATITNFYTTKAASGTATKLIITGTINTTVAQVQVGSGFTYYSTINAAVTAWKNAADGATLKLLTDVTTSSTINVTGTKTLDLNGQGIKHTGNNSVFKVPSGAELNLNDSGNTEHKFTYTPLVSGLDAGLATVNDSASENYQTFTGGYITGGKGSADPNSASNYRWGGAVMIAGGIFNMYGGTLIGNSVGNGGGAVYLIASGSAFNMYGGKIMYNKAQHGGAIRINSNTMTMYGGEISHNACEWDGGGIHASSGTFTMTGGVIEKNVAGHSGSGVHQGNLTISGDSVIRDNVISTNKNGAGIYMPNSLKISGSPTITGNKKDGNDSNVYLGNNVKITVDNAMSNTLPIGITMQTPGVFTAGGNAAQYADCFTSDDEDYIVQTEGDELKLAVKPHEHNDIAFTVWTSNNSLPTTAGSYYLKNDVTISSTWNVPTGTTNLCLNGHVITRSGNGDAISLNGSDTLNIYDCGTTERYYKINTSTHRGEIVDSKDGADGSFTGGYITAANGRGISTPATENLESYVNMYGGTVFSCNSTCGAGIYSFGHFHMYDGAFIGNFDSGQGEQWGGAVYNAGELVIEGGLIRHNYDFRGGGVFQEMWKNSTGTIKGGRIVDNIATDNGGGVYLNYNSPTKPKFIICGNPEISGNKVGDSENNVYIPDKTSQYVSVGGELSNATPIGISMKTPGVFTNSTNVAFNDAGKFTSDNESYVVIKNGSNQLELISANTVASVTSGDTTTYYDTLKEAISNAPNGSTVTLLKDVTETQTAYCDNNNYEGTGNVIDGKTITITSNGIGDERKTVTGSRFDVKNGGNLTLKNIIIDGGVTSSASKVDGTPNSWSHYLMAASHGSTLTFDTGTLVINYYASAHGVINAGGGRYNVYNASNNGSTINIKEGSVFQNLGANFGVFRADYKSTINMSGGLVTKCTSYQNEGVLAYVAQGSTFNMSGGEISNCSPEGVAPGVVFLHSSQNNGHNTFTMTGGTIQSNTAILGGAVYSASVNNVITIGGSATIANGNTGTQIDNGQTGSSNIYLADRQTMTIDSTHLGGTSNIGVYTKTAPTESADVKIAMGANKDDIKYIHSDLSGNAGTIFCDGTKDWMYYNDTLYEITNTHHTHEAGTIWLTVTASIKAKTVTYDANGATNGNVPTDNKPYNIGDKVTVLGNTGSLTRDGYTFDGWNTKADGSGTAYAENAAFTITEDTTLFAQWMKDYAYLDAVWNATEKRVDYPEKYIGADKVTLVNAATTKWNSGWYAVTENVTISGRVTVSGDVKLILCNGATLTATNGISVDQGNTFTVYGQTLEQNEMGSLYSRYGSTTGQAAAGIGGSGRGKKAGKITINGGKIFTSGSREAGGAGIGGGFQATGTDTTINGGYITIPARKSVAGIGGGREASSGNITINGGNLNVGGYSGASIGGSYHGSANTITIRGGYIKATNYTRGAAIGSGERNNSKTNAGTINISGGTVIATNAAGSGSGAAAIGGGYNVPGGTVNISGGTVIATSTYGAGIGGGPGANGGKVNITGGTVTAYSSNGGVGIGAGKGKTGHGTLTIASTHVSSAGNSESTAAACFNYVSHRKKYVKIWEHTHSAIEYGIEGNVLYAQCTNDVKNCNMLGGRLTLTLDAYDKLYDKKAYDKAKTTWYSVNHNEWDEFSKITGTTASSGGVIEYYKAAAEGSPEEKLGSAPVDEGKYIAKLPVVINSENKYLEKEFEIVKPEAYFVTVPEAKELAYTSEPQDLITAGEGKDGTIHYSLDNKEWSTSVPQGTDAGTYSVWFKVVGDDFHKNSGTFSVDVTIRKAAALDLEENQKPAARTDFPKDSEKEEGEELVIAPKDSLPEGYKMYYAVGEDETTVPEEGWSTDIPKGMEGTYHIWFKVVKVDAKGNEDKNYEETAPEVMKVEWIPEYNVIYDENESTGGKAPVDAKYYKENDVVTVLDQGTLVKSGYVFGGWYTKGEDVFVDEDASAGEESSSDEGSSAEKESADKVYQAGDTFGIASDMTLSAKWIPIAKVTVAPKGGELAYSGGAQELVTAGEAEGGTILYALGTSAETVPAEGSAWSTEIPAAAGLGTYYIWYKAAGDADHADSEVACVPSTIIKADLGETVVALTMKGYSYGAEPSVPAVSSASAEINQFLKDAEVRYYYNKTNSNEGGTEWKNITGKTLHAGTYYMYAEIPATANYNGYITKAKAFTVEKATWTKTEVFGSSTAGAEGSVALTDYIAEGGRLGDFSIDNQDSQDAGYPSRTDNTLKFKFKETVQVNETIAVIKIPVTGAVNYKDYTITATVSAPAKSFQALSFGADHVSKTYGDKEFTINPVRGKGERDYGAPYGEITYSSSDPAVAEVNAYTGEVTIMGAGTAVITAKAARTNPVEGDKENKPGYLPAAASYTLTVNKKAVTVKAEDQSIYVGGTIPDLTSLVQDVHYTVTGLVGQDGLKNVPMLSYQRNGKKVNPVNTKPGTYDIVPSGTGAGSNYTLSYESGTLAITSKKEQIITAENVTVTYGETGRSVNASVTEPEEGGGEISYAVKDGSEDYIEVDPFSGALTVKKVPADGKAYVTVTAAETAVYAKAAQDVTVTINKTDIREDGLTVTMENYGYGTEPSVPAVSSASADISQSLKNAEVKYYYNTADSNEGGTEWKGITGKTLHAGTYYMYAEIPATANYNGYKTKATAFTVEKATWTKTEVFGSSTAGIEGSVALTDYIAEGGSLGDFTIDNQDSQDAGYPSRTDHTLKFKFKETAQGNETIAVITIPVTGAANYRDYTITATVSAPAKSFQALSFGADNVSKTYGDEKFTISPVRGEGERDYGEPYGEITYSSSDPAVAEVNAYTGEVTIMGAGTAVITAKAARTNPVDVDKENKPGYLPAAASYTLTVGRKAVTVKAKDQSMNVGDTIPDLTKPVPDTHYTITGLVGQDGLKNVPTLSYQKIGSNAEPDSNKTGTYDIVPSGADAGSNYIISYESGVLTINRGDIKEDGFTVTMENYGYGLDPSAPAVSSASAELNSILKNAEVKYYYNTTNSNEGGTEWKGITGKTLHAGTYYMYAEIPATANYNGYKTKATAFTVEKATWTKTEVFGSSTAGIEGSVALTDYIAEGGSLGDFSIDNQDSQDAGYPSITDHTLKFRFKETAQRDETIAVITIPVTEAANYKDYTITATVSAPAKIPQILTFGADHVLKTYGDEKFTINPDRGKGEGDYGEPYGKITYSSSDPAVAEVNDSTGEVTIRGAGTAVITAKAARTNPVEGDKENKPGYLPAAASYALTVNKKAVTVKAEDQSIYVGDTIPDLTEPVSDTHYTITGLVGQDGLKNVPTLSYQKNGSNAEPDSNKAGTYDIVPSGADAGDNYTIRYESGKLTIANKAPDANKLTVTKTSGPDKNDGVISGLNANEKYEYSTDGGENWIPVEKEKTTIENLAAGDVLIRYPGDEDVNPSEAAKVTVGTKKDRTAPDADKLSVTKTSGADQKDGVISGLNADEKYEYSTDGGKTWTPVENGKTTIENLPAGEVLIRYPGDEDTNPSEAAKVTVGTKGDGTAPDVNKLTVTKTSGADQKDGVISGLNADEKYEYSTDGGKTWTQVENGKTTIENLPAGEVLIRKQGDEDTNPSEAAKVTVGTKGDGTAPDVNKLTVTKTSGPDKNDGVISGLDPDEKYEYSTDGGKTWTQVEKGKTTIENLPAGEVLIRKQGDKDTNPSEAARVTVGTKGDGTVPDVNKLTVTKTSGAGKKDGVISGLNANEKYEYSTDGGKTWTPVEKGKTTIENLPAGEVLIRKPGDEDTNPSEAARVTVGTKGDGTAPDVNKLTVTKTSGAGKKDGVISGLDTDEKYEYSTDGGTTWTPVEKGKTTIENLPAGEVLIRKPGDEDTNPSEAAKVTVGTKGDGTAPDVNKLTVTKTSGADQKDGAISGLDPDEKYEYSTDGGKTWTPVENGKTTIENLPAGEVLIRKPGDDDTNPSEAAKVTVGTKGDGTAPDANKLTVTKTSGADQKDGAISGLDPDEKYEYSTDGGKTWTPVENGKTTIENLPAGEVWIRKPGDDDTNPSEAAKVTVGTKGDGTAPDANKLTVTKTSGAGKKDGVISGLNANEKYEYSTDGGKTWTPVEKGKTTIENLPAGEVLIRKQGDDDTNPSKAAKVTVGTKEDVTAPDVNKPATNPSEAVKVNAGTKEDQDAISLNAGFKVTQKGSKISVKWGKVKDADGYRVYVTYCGKSFSKKPAKRTTTKTSAVITKINGKKINLKKNFKVYVAAVKKDGSKIKQLARTLTGHIVGRKNTRFTNVKSITLKTKTISVAVGKTSKIKAKAVLVNKKKKQLSDAHAAEFRYASFDQSIATVDKKGNVKGVSAGTTTVYVYARNGLARTVKVTVK